MKESGGGGQYGEEERDEVTEESSTAGEQGHPGLHGRGWSCQGPPGFR